ncbi:MAG: GatB/YqeY domain-containing protein [Slackia sp.]
MLKEQVAILEEYLPQVSGDELIALIEKTIADLGVETKRDMKVMGALTAATGGNFDKAAAAKEVGSRLA